MNGRVPITVELRNGRGDVIRQLDDPAGGTFDAAEDVDRLLQHVAEPAASSPGSAYVLLRYVDPYGDTVFNHVQMDDLLRDLDTAGRLAATPAEQRSLARLQVMARRCKAGVHLYVWFIGD